jgi:hypothetical protein
MEMEPFISLELAWKLYLKVLSSFLESENSPALSLATCERAQKIIDKAIEVEE